jgi:hypothetical protein
MQSCSHAVTEKYYGIMGSGGMCKRVLRFGGSAVRQLLENILELSVRK